MSDDRRLTDYLLGRLTEPEQIRVEEEYLSDPDVQERLLAVEDDLIEAYVQHELSDQERIPLEAGLLASARGRRKLEVARSLVQLAAAAPVVTSDRRSTPHPAVRWAALAAVLVFGVLLARSLGRQNPPDPQPESARPSLPTAAPSPDGGGRPGPDRPAPPSITLRPVTRTSQEGARLSIPRDVSTAALVLVVEGGAYERYRVDLLGAGEDPLWSARGLRTRSTAAGLTLPVDVPVERLPNGENTLLLSPDGAAPQPIAEYSVTITRR